MKSRFKTMKMLENLLFAQMYFNILICLTLMKKAFLSIQPIIVKFVIRLEMIQNVVFQLTHNVTSDAFSLLPLPAIAIYN